MAEGFAIRHRFLLLILWVHVPALALLGLFTDRDLIEVGLVCLTIVALALVAMLASGRGLPATAIASGMAVSACFVVRFSGDLEFMHLYFAATLAAVAYYRLALPLLAALAGISAYHLVVGLWLPGTDGLLGASLHTAFLTLITLVLMAGWALEEEDAAAVNLENDRYWTSFHAAPIGMAVLKPSGEFLEANEALAALLGHETGHFPGRNIRAFVDSDDMPVLGEAWEAIGNSRSHSFSAWMRWLTDNGRAIWGRVSLALVPRTERQTAMVIIQVEEATRSRQEQDRLEQLLHGKDEFIAAVGTEIKEPLGTLIDLTEDDPVLRDLNARAREAAAVVDDLVASARADTSPPDVVPTEFDVAATCRRILEAIPGGEDVEVDVRARTMWADPDLTTQIVTGMLGNAIRYGGPRIRVQIFNSGPDTVVQVVENGTAIPDGQRERIFSGDLRRGQPVTRPAAVGLSLTVGRHLARRMEGDITYRRTGDDLNVFELRLPSEELTRTYRPRQRPSLGKAPV